MNIQRVSRKCLKIFCEMHLNRNGRPLQCLSKILSVKKCPILSSAWTSMHKCVPERRLRGILNYKWRGGPSLTSPSKGSTTKNWFFLGIFPSLTSPSYSVFLELKKTTDIRPFKNAFVIDAQCFCFARILLSITTIKIGGSLKSLISPPTWKDSLQISGALSLISKLIGSSAEEMGWGGRGGSTEHSCRIIVEDVF